MLRDEFRSARRGPVLECLEGRVLLAATGTVPILFVMVEGGPTYEHDLHPDHNAEYFSGLLSGFGGFGSTVQATTINYSSLPGGSQGHFGTDAAFPWGDGDNFALRARAELNVSAGQAGTWTFGVNTDDGCRLSIDGLTVITDDATHPAADRFGTAYLSSGSHTLELVYFEYLVAATVELFAAPGTHGSFNANFKLVGDPAGLDTVGNFEVVHRFSREAVDSLADADRLLGEPFHNVVGYFKENSGGKLILVPATAGELEYHLLSPPTVRDGRLDGVVGPYEFPTFEKSPEVKRRLTIQLADASGDFNFRAYDKNHNGWLEQDELIVVSIGSDENGNEFWRTFPKPGAGRVYEEGDFQSGTLTRETRWDAGWGRYYDVIKGKLLGQTTWTDYQYRYYAHPNPPAGRDYWPRNEAEAHGAALGGEFAGWGIGGNLRGLDQTLWLPNSQLWVPQFYAVPGCGDWTGWESLVHEISHVLGNQFRDLYNLEEFGQATGIWMYGTMSYTNGRTYHHDPWTKARVGWVTPTTIAASGWYTLSAVETSGQVLKIQRNANEYFLIENRWPGTSYDGRPLSTRDVPGLAAGGVPDEGLAIWHIDETRLDEFDGGTFTGTPFITKEDAGAAGNAADDLWDSGEAFTAFSASNSNWNDGTRSNIVIARISAPGPVMTFWVGFGGVVPDNCEPNDTYEFTTNLGAGDKTINGLSIHSGDADIFKWVAPAGGTLNVDILFQHARGDLDLFLHAADPSHTQLASSTSTTDNEHLSYTVVGGTVYYVRVVGWGGAINDDYDLIIDGPNLVGDRFEPNDGSANPASVGTGQVIQYDLTIHAPGNDDWYVWTASATGPANFHIIFQHALGDLELEVYRQSDMYRLGGWYSTSDDEGGWVDVTAGAKYLIRVYGYGGATHPDYDLGVSGAGANIPADGMEPNPNFEFAWHVGTGDRSFSNLTIHTAWDADVFEWVAPDDGYLSVDLTFSHGIADLDLYVYDFAESLLAGSETRTDNEHVDLVVEKGKHYYVRVIGRYGVCHSNYGLSLNGPDVSPDRFEQNDTSMSATAFGVGNRIETGLTCHSPGDDDWYEWVAWSTGRLDVHLFFEHAAGDLDLYVYYGAGVIGGSSSTTDDEHVTGLSVSAGQTYLIRVQPYGSAMHHDYTLWIDGPGILPDSYEPNDSVRAAQDLGTGDLGVYGLTIHSGGNEDWFLWTSRGTGQAVVDILFDITRGDVDAILYDAALREIAAGYSTTDNEHLVADVVGGQAYYLRVYGYGGAMHDDYDIVFDGPEPQVDLLGTFFDVRSEMMAAGDAFTAYYTIANQGPDPAGGFWVDFYISTDGVLDDADLRLGYQHVYSVGGGADTGVLSVSLALPGLGDAFWNAQGSGTYTIGMMVDHDPALIAETNEANNRNRGDGLDLDAVYVVTSPLDYGDAPDPTYPTLRASNGARHGRGTGAGLCLGLRVDAEADGWQSADALGDDSNGDADEDGVAFTSPLIPGRNTTVSVTVSGGGLLNAWVDFNGNGSWYDEGEQVFTDVPVGGGLNNLIFPVPAGATPGVTYARFRLDSGGGLSPTGLAADGEVEDHALLIIPGATIAGVTFHDADGDGSRGVGEAAQDGWTVFLDHDDDGVIDAGEDALVTGPAGAYAFTGLAAGTYYVRQVAQAHWTQTCPLPMSTGRYVVVVTSGEAAGGATLGGYDFGSAICGDADGNRYVDLPDLIVLARNWHASPATWGQGDFDGNNYVDLPDLIILARNWRAGTPPAGGALGASLPVGEPVSAAVPAVGDQPASESAVVAASLDRAAEAPVEAAAVGAPDSGAVATPRVRRPAVRQTALNHVQPGEDSSSRAVHGPAASRHLIRPTALGHVQPSGGTPRRAARQAAGRGAAGSALDRVLASLEEDLADLLAAPHGQADGD